MTSLLQIAVEGLVSVLLAMTIGYCVLLNSRLKRLRADEANLRATISELLTATEIAERAITGLKQTATECDKTLAQRLREAEFFSMEISREIAEGEKVLGRIAQITQAARAATTAAAAAEDRLAQSQVHAQQAQVHAEALARAQAQVLAEAQRRAALGLGAHGRAAEQGVGATPLAASVQPAVPHVAAAPLAHEALRASDRLGVLKSRAAEAAERVASIRRATTEAA